MITLRHELAMALVIIGAGATGIGALALVLTALTLRGDLVALAAVISAFVLVTITLARAARRFQTRAGGSLRIARTIAEERRSALPCTARAELLGALETWWILAGRHLPSPAVLGSRQLAEAYVERVDARLQTLGDVAPLPPLSTRALLSPLALALALAGMTLSFDSVRKAVPLLLRAVDGRPVAPPGPLWSSLSLTLHYPEHTARAARIIENPSGPMRLLRGTRVAIQLRAEPGTEAISWVLGTDGAALSEDTAAQFIALHREESGFFTGDFTVEMAGTWSIAATIQGAERSSPPAKLEIEPDLAPEVELLPLAHNDRSPSELDSVELRFRARDDFGLTSAELVIRNGDKAPTRLDLGVPPIARTWSHRYDWDLSKMPLEERSEIEFWIEIRDNDPEPDPTSAGRTGKVTRSTHMRLTLHDRETEHAANIESLRELRDTAVDHLARRMTTPAFDHTAELGAQARLDEARSLHAECGDLLAMLATCLDRLAVDPLSSERDTTMLASIHGRLREVFVREEKSHERLPVGAEIGAPGRLRRLLATLAGTNARQIRQLEDEIIRLDDLVDNQIVARIEGLVARVEASQRKLVDQLERLKAGDRSVTPMIEQLHRRLREDLRRLQDARSQLNKEVDSEFLNLDALQAMQARMEHEDLSEQLRRGDVDGALERARERLEELRDLRNSVQDRLDDAPETQVSPAERSRLRLLRALSRLQDSERGVATESRDIHQSWREQVSKETLASDEAKALQAAAAKLQRKLRKVNDARLGRQGRRALGDAQEQLRRLATTRGALEAQESAAAVDLAIHKALRSANPGEPEAKQLAKLRAAAAKLRRRTAGSVAPPEELLAPPEGERLMDLGSRQAGLEAHARELLRSPDAAQLPKAGTTALRSAAEGLQLSRDALQERRTGEAVRAETSVIDQLQLAIDSLRQTAKQPRGGPSRASTASERDRSLRDEVMEAMREEAPEGYSEPVKRYYEELLR